MEKSTQPMVRLNVAKDEKLTVGGSEFQTFMIHSTKTFVVHCKSTVAYIVCIYAHVLLRLWWMC